MEFQGVANILIGNKEIKQTIKNSPVNVNITSDRRIISTDYSKDRMKEEAYNENLNASFSIIATDENMLFYPDADYFEEEVTIFSKNGNFLIQIPKCGITISHNYSMKNELSSISFELQALSNGLSNKDFYLFDNYSDKISSVLVTGDSTVGRYSTFDLLVRRFTKESGWIEITPDSWIVLTPDVLTHISDNTFRADAVGSGYVRAVFEGVQSNILKIEIVREGEYIISPTGTVRTASESEIQFKAFIQKFGESDLIEIDPTLVNWEVSGIGQATIDENGIFKAPTNTEFYPPIISNVRFSVGFESTSQTRVHTVKQFLYSLTSTSTEIYSNQTIKLTGYLEDFVNQTKTTLDDTLVDWFVEDSTKGTIDSTGLFTPAFNSEGVTSIGYTVKATGEVHKIDIKIIYAGEIRIKMISDTVLNKGRTGYYVAELKETVNGDFKEIHTGYSVESEDDDFVTFNKLGEFSIGSLRQEGTTFKFRLILSNSREVSPFVEITVKGNPYIWYEPNNFEMFPNETQTFKVFVSYSEEGERFPVEESLIELSTPLYIGTMNGLTFTPSGTWFGQKDGFFNMERFYDKDGTNLFPITTFETVIGTIKLKALVIKPELTELFVGQTVQMEAYYQLDDNVIEPIDADLVDWSISDTRNGTIDSSGVFTCTDESDFEIEVYAQYEGYSQWQVAKIKNSEFTRGIFYGLDLGTFDFRGSDGATNKLAHLMATNNDGILKEVSYNCRYESNNPEVVETSTNSPLLKVIGMGPFSMDIYYRNKFIENVQVIGNSRGKLEITPSEIEMFQGETSKIVPIQTFNNLGDNGIITPINTDDVTWEITGDIEHVTFEQDGTITCNDENNFEVEIGYKYLGISCETKTVVKSNRFVEAEFLSRYTGTIEIGKEYEIFVEAYFPSTGLREDVSDRCQFFTNNPEIVGNSDGKIITPIAEGEFTLYGEFLGRPMGNFRIYGNARYDFAVNFFSMPIVGRDNYLIPAEENVQFRVGGTMYFSREIVQQAPNARFELIQTGFPDDDKVYQNGVGNFKARVNNSNERVVVRAYDYINTLQRLDVNYYVRTSEIVRIAVTGLPNKASGENFHRVKVGESYQLTAFVFHSTDGTSEIDEYDVYYEYDEKVARIEKLEKGQGHKITLLKEGDFELIPYIEGFIGPPNNRIVCSGVNIGDIDTIESPVLKVLEINGIEEYEEIEVLASVVGQPDVLYDISKVVEIQNVNVDEAEIVKTSPHLKNKVLPLKKGTAELVATFEGKTSLPTTFETFFGNKGVLSFVSPQGGGKTTVIEENQVMEVHSVMNYGDELILSVDDYVLYTLDDLFTHSFEMFVEDGVRKIRNNSSTGQATLKGILTETSHLIEDTANLISSDTSQEQVTKLTLSHTIGVNNKNYTREKVDLIVKAELFSGEIVDVSDQFIEVISSTINDARVIFFKGTEHTSFISSDATNINISVKYHGVTSNSISVDIFEDFVTIVENGFENDVQDLLLLHYLQMKLFNVYASGIREEIFDYDKISDICNTEAGNDELLNFSSDGKITCTNLVTHAQQVVILPKYDDIRRTHMRKVIEVIEDDPNGKVLNSRLQIHNGTLSIGEKDVPITLQYRTEFGMNWLDLPDSELQMADIEITDKNGDVNTDVVINTDTNTISILETLDYNLVGIFTINLKWKNKAGEIMQLHTPYNLNVIPDKIVESIDAMFEHSEAVESIKEGLQEQKILLLHKNFDYITFSKVFLPSVLIKYDDGTSYQALETSDFSVRSSDNLNFDVIKNNNGFEIHPFDYDGVLEKTEIWVEIQGIESIHYTLFFRDIVTIGNNHSNIRNKYLTGTEIKNGTKINVWGREGNVSVDSSKEYILDEKHYTVTNVFGNSNYEVKLNIKDNVISVSEDDYDLNGIYRGLDVCNLPLRRFYSGKISTQSISRHTLIPVWDGAFYNGYSRTDLTVGGLRNVMATLKINENNEQVANVTLDANCNYTVEDETILKVLENRKLVEGLKAGTTNISFDFNGNKTVLPFTVLASTQVNYGVEVHKSDDDSVIGLVPFKEINNIKTYLPSDYKLLLADDSIFVKDEFGRISISQRVITDEIQTLEENAKLIHNGEEIDVSITIVI